MGANPAYKKMNLNLTKMILAYHSVSISTDVKNNPITTKPQDIIGTICQLDILRIIPVSKFQN
jgi:hypothetical protein